jgi:hypothetical protein
LFGAITMVVRCTRSITLAMEKVFPDPVTPSSVWCASPSFNPSTSFSMACGWSPAGLNLLCKTNGFASRFGIEKGLWIGGRMLSRICYYTVSRS